MASTAIRTLPFVVQEAVYDAIDSLAADPSHLVERGTLTGRVYDFDIYYQGIRHTIFIIVDPNDRSQVLEILRVGCSPPFQT